jgi:hypothetical protein
MKITKEETIPERKQTVHDHTICDLCKQRIKEPGAYEREEVTIEHMSGVAYPDGRSISYTRVDLCPNCFTNKLIPWLVSQGCKITETDEDY